MARKDFHKLIEQQNLEEKEEFWLRLQKQLDAEQVVVAPKKKKTFAFWKVLSASTSVAVVLVLGLGLGLGLTLNRGSDDIADNNPSTPTEPSQPIKRYCGLEDCKIEKSEYSLKQYSEQYNGKLLYLDWYDEAEDYEGFLYTLKTTGEAVCLEESFMNSDGEYVSIFVIDNRTETDFLTQYTAETGEESLIGDLPVYYQHGLGYTKLNFEYEDYQYFLEITYEDADYLLQIAEQMLSNL